MITEEKFIVVFDGATLNALLTIAALPRVSFDDFQDCLVLEVETSVAVHTFLTGRTTHQSIVGNIRLAAYDTED